jgi:hypothetical protein
VGRHFSAAKNLPRILWKSEIFSIEAADALRPLLLSFVLWEENRRSFDYGGKGAAFAQDDTVMLDAVGTSHFAVKIRK